MASRTKSLWKDIMSGHCTLFPDTFLGVYIGNCCKGHDGNCSTGQFYKCLTKLLAKHWAMIITGGGAIGCWVRYTKGMLKRL